jgi:hypothetical protein
MKKSHNQLRRLEASMKQQRLSPTELEAFRRLLFLSVPEAAQMIGAVSEQTWRRWEAGTRRIPADVIGRVAHTLAWRSRYIESMLQRYRAGTQIQPFALLWYSSKEDWLSLAENGVAALWRAHQSACASVLDDLGKHGLLVPFHGAAYVEWLGDRTDTCAMRGAWAAYQATT